MNATHKRVMLVDDEEAVRLSWSRFLSERDFDVTTAEDGKVAITRLEHEPVDVVVADLRMPTVDGLQLLQWMSGSTPNTPFILLTGYGSDEVERKARELGAYGYLNKPIDPDKLAELIHSATMIEPAVAGEASLREPALAAPVAEVEAPAEAVVEPVEAAPVEAEAAVTAESHPGAVRRTSEIVGGLIAAPLLGLAFVMFLPLIGFAALFKVAVEAITQTTKPAGT